MINFTESVNRITFTVRAVPRAAKSEIVGEFQGALKIRIASPPVNGAANAELIKLLSKVFSLPKNNIEILSGAKAKTKQIRISDLSREAFLGLLETNFSGKQ